jgi:hypothetical protein
MFNPARSLIGTFVERLRHAYRRTYGHTEPAYAEIIARAARLAMEYLVRSDALYHNFEHTIMVTLAGQDILIGKQLCEGDVSPRDWLHCILSLLYHDIGYVRHLCRDDRDGAYSAGLGGDVVTLRPGATDAALAPYHVDRGKLFVQERFGDHDVIEVEILAANIERTRFPVPVDQAYQEVADYPGLIRAADLIGQLADPHYLRKLPALFYEFAEIGYHTKLGYSTPDDMRDGYPDFFRNGVEPYVRTGLCYLRLTPAGQQWITNLYAHLATLEGRKARRLYTVQQGCEPSQ